MARQCATAKNMAEQLAVLERDRIITAQVLLNYLPQEAGRSNLPMRIENQPKEDFSERDILYKVLFDMKRDMVELKKLVADIIEHGGVSVNQANHSQTLKQLYHDIELPGNAEPQFTLQQPVNNTVISSNGNNDTYNLAHDAEEVEESLSLIEKESDLIRKALKKHKGKRKLAANELGISERTLYRKIKELNL